MFIMKIWKAELFIVHDTNRGWRSEFIFEKQEREYNANEKFNEWTYSKDWVTDRIPMDMKAEYNCGALIVTKGFDHELNDVELDSLKFEMKNFMVDKVNRDKEEYLLAYQKKIDAIQSFV